MREKKCEVTSYLNHVVISIAGGTPEDYKRVGELITKALAARSADDKWSMEYENDTGPEDGYFVETWTVTDGNRSFKVSNEGDAVWLRNLLNGQPK